MAMTQTGDVSWDRDVWESEVRYSLRGELHYDRVATVKPKSAGKGARVGFTIVTDLAAATTALTEDTDVTPATMGDSVVYVTLAEYGNAVQTSKLLRGTSVLPVDPIAANVVGRNMGVSTNEIALAVLVAGTNVRYGGNATARNNIDASTPDYLKATNVRRARAELANARVGRVKNGLYAAFVNPDPLVDLREETGEGAWRAPHIYSDPQAIYTGEVGAFEGFFFVEDSYAPVLVNAGSGSTVDVYQSLFLGDEALAKAHSNIEGNGPSPQIVVGPVTDTLRRFVPLGWFWLGGYGRFREAALRRLETASSLGTNS